MNIILGSQSPRRRELFAGLDLPFTAITIDCDETYPDNLTAGDIPLYIAKQKATAYLSSHTYDLRPTTYDPQPHDLLITADTIVWLDNKMLGKPKDEDDAKHMLRQLSGNTHQVYTAVCLTWLDNSQPQQSFVCSTDVTFRQLDDSEINYYVEHYKPLDKAGAYGIQEWIGYVGITDIKGSYYNVMGLPIQRLHQYLQPIMIPLLGKEG